MHPLAMLNWILRYSVENKSQCTFCFFFWVREIIDELSEERFGNFSVKYKT